LRDNRNRSDRLHDTLIRQWVLPWRKEPPCSARISSETYGGFMSDMDAIAGQSGVWVHTKFYWFNFLLVLFKPNTSVDGGTPVRGRWGATFIPLPPGRHLIRCYVSYLWYRHMGDSTVEVTVLPDAPTSVQWRAPWLVFIAGKWKNVEA
jgi:hypothetical protein